MNTFQNEGVILKHDTKFKDICEINLNNNYEIFCIIFLFFGFLE